MSTSRAWPRDRNAAASQLAQACQANICSLSSEGCNSLSTPSTVSSTCSRNADRCRPWRRRGALRHLVDLGRFRPLTARRGHRGGQPGRLQGRHGLAERGRADPLLEEAEFVVFDLETTGLSSARDRICELEPFACARSSRRLPFQSLVNPRVALPEPVARLTGLREEEPERAPSVASVLERSRRSPATTCSLRTTRASTSASSSASSRGMSDGSRSAALHRGARATTAPRGRAAPCRPCLARPLLRRIDAAVPPRAARRRGDRRSARPADRARAGDRRAPASELARSPLQASAASTTSGVGARRADAARCLPLSRPPRPGVVRRPGPRPARAPPLLLPQRPAATVGRGCAARARADRVARARLGSRPHSRRYG